MSQEVPPPEVPGSPEKIPVSRYPYGLPTAASEISRPKLDHHLSVVSDDERPRLSEHRCAMMAAAVAHDVRSILTSLSANASALAAQYPFAKRLGWILEDIGFLKHTIEMMEQYAKPLSVQRQRENILNIMHHAVAKARQAIVQQGYDSSAVQIAVSDVVGLHAEVSRRLVVLALANVVQNALESYATPHSDALKPGHIEVRGVESRSGIQITVRDDSSGMEPEVLDRLLTFVPMGPNKSKRCSSGWGLSLAHKYVAAHEGTVNISSGLGQGTTVVITLPACPSSGEESE